MDSFKTAHNADKLGGPSRSTRFLNAFKHPSDTMKRLELSLPTRKRMMLATGVVFIVLGAIFPLLGLSYVLYWGPTPDTSPPPFPYYSFWSGIAFLVIGLIALAVAGYGVKE